MIIIGLAERLGRTVATIKHPIASTKKGFDEGYAEGTASRTEKRIESEEMKVDSYKEYKEKTSAPAKHTTQVKQAPRPIIKNYYSGGTSSGKGRRASSGSRVTHAVNQGGKFADVNARVVDTTNSQVNRLNSYDKKMRDMFG